jgi:peptide-methionine (R)-S-oxide reductase
MNRRTFLNLLGVGSAGIFVPELPALAQSPADMKAITELQANWKTFLAAGAKVELSREPLKRSNAEWKLSRQATICEEGQNRPDSPLNNKSARVYCCAGCTLPLFTTAMKYDSGTGWPSFFTTIPDVFGTKRDFKLILPRTEYHCVRCGGHHGHVFEDGPRPTGLRYCNNGVALRFIAKGDKA